MGDLRGVIDRQRAGFRGLGCPFYDRLGAELELDLDADGPVGALLAPHADAPFEAAYVLRLFGGIHRLVLSGCAPAVARHFPSTGGDGDATAAMAAIRDVVASSPAALLDALSRPPQTNEVGRSAALASGLLVVAHELQLPLRLREMGASAALNSRFDRFWYEQDGVGWGRRDSKVRFVDLWRGGVPPFSANLSVIDRRACDRDPIDATTAEGALTLLSYVWPEPPERFARARAAIAIAADAPVTIDRADVLDWLPGQLAEPHAGQALVVFHSVFWQYLPTSTKASLAGFLAEAGADATRNAPLAWLRLEPNELNYNPAELRLTIWNGSPSGPTETLLATTGFHGGPIEWRG